MNHYLRQMIRALGWVLLFVWAAMLLILLQFLVLKLLNRDWRGFTGEFAAGYLQWLLLTALGLYAGYSLARLRRHALPAILLLTAALTLVYTLSYSIPFLTASQLPPALIAVHLFFLLVIVVHLAALLLAFINHRRFP